MISAGIAIISTPGTPNRAENDWKSVYLLIIVAYRRSSLQIWGTTMIFRSIIAAASLLFVSGLACAKAAVFTFTFARQSVEVTVPNSVPNSALVRQEILDVLALAPFLNYTFSIDTAEFVYRGGVFGGGFPPGRIAVENASADFLLPLPIMSSGPNYLLPRPWDFGLFFTNGDVGEGMQFRNYTGGGGGFLQTPSYTSPGFASVDGSTQILFISAIAASAIVDESSFISFLSQVTGVTMRFFTLREDGVSVTAAYGLAAPVVPLPAAGWLLVTGMVSIGFARLKRRERN